MKKRGLLLTLLLGIMFIGLVSAQYGYYGSFSIGNFLDQMGATTIILFVLFIIIFLVLNNIVFINFFRGNKAVAGIVSLCISFLAIYGLWKTKWDIEGLFYGFGIGESSLFTIVSVILILMVIIAAFKRKLRYVFLSLGLVLIGLALFTDLLYERGLAFIVGAILLVLWLWMWRRHVKRYGRRRPYDQDYARRGRGSMRRRHGRFKQTVDYIDPRERLARGRARDELRARRKQKTYETGRKMGHGIGRTMRAGRKIGGAVKRRRVAGMSKRLARKGIRPAWYKGRP